MERELSVGSVFGTAFSVFRDRARMFVPIGFASALLLTMWAVLLPVVVVERPGVFDAFGRSRQLVRGKGWKVFGIILPPRPDFLLGLILVATGLPFFFLHYHHVGGELARRLLSALVSAVTTPFTLLVIGALYYRLLDLEGQESVPSAGASVLE
ncbi:MAG TPA: hypothetical protein VNC15_11090 [Solirubrobacterales bacterium]|nr:hypothetical protein [Solirubrobacterales bacterium]